MGLPMTLLVWRRRNFLGMPLGCRSCERGDFLRTRPLSGLRLRTSSCSSLLPSTILNDMAESKRRVQCLNVLKPNWENLLELHPETRAAPFITVPVALPGYINVPKFVRFFDSRAVQVRIAQRTAAPSALDALQPQMVEASRLWFANAPGREFDLRTASMNYSQFFAASKDDFVRRHQPLVKLLAGPLIDWNSAMGTSWRLDIRKRISIHRCEVQAVLSVFSSLDRSRGGRTEKVATKSAEMDRHET